MRAKMLSGPLSDLCWLIDCVLNIAANIIENMINSKNLAAISAQKIDFEDVFTILLMSRILRMRRKLLAS